jgi:hypothetical protein
MVDEATQETQTEKKVELGDMVKCRSCHREYELSVFNDYYGFTNHKDGQCENCMLREAFAKSSPTPVPSEEHIENVCKRGQGPATCVFLIYGGKWECAKGSDMGSAILEKKAQGTMLSAGDNCSGPPDFTPIS